MSASEVIRLNGVGKQYGSGANALQVLRDVNITIRQGEFLAIMGASGSGKSTLLNILGLLDRPTTGEYMLQGEDVAGLDDDIRSGIRCLKIGVVFQFFNLFPQLTVLENVCVPLQYADAPHHRMISRAELLLRSVGLGERMKHRPGQLSGGECQRTAIARALANDPPIILADEPTGNLDAATGNEIIQVFRNLAREGRTVVMVTHNDAYTSLVDRVIALSDGRVIRQ